MEGEENKNNEIKVILVGDAGVGKTCLINVSIGMKFNEDEISSSSSTFTVKKMNINNKQYKINLWDTIGQESLRNLTKLFFNNSKIVIFVYDISNKESFDDLPNWVKDVEEKLGINIVKGVVANKSDLYLNEKVTEDEGKEYAKKLGAKFLTISEKEDDPKKFDDFLDLLVREYIGVGEEIENKNFTLEKPKGNQKKKRKFC